MRGHITDEVPRSHQVQEASPWGAGRRGRSKVTPPSLKVLGEGGEPSPGAGGRRGGAGVWSGSTVVAGGGGSN